MHPWKLYDVMPLERGRGCYYEKSFTSTFFAEYTMNGSVKTDCLYRTADLQQGAPMAKNQLAINARCKCVIE